MDVILNENYYLIIVLVHVAVWAGVASVIHKLLKRIKELERKQ